MKRVWMLCALIAAAPVLAAEPNVPELMRRARTGMSIRSVRSAPFRLRAQIEIRMANGVRRGIYEEIWLAPDKWRDTVRLGTLHQTRVVSGEYLWRLKSLPVVPYWFRVLDSAMRLDALQEEPHEIRRVRYSRWRAEQKWLTCADFRSAPMLCFEPGEGLLVREDSTAMRVEYSNFQDWQGRKLPMHIEILYNGQPTIIAVVENIGPAGEVSPALFNRPENAEERCPNPERPRLLKSVKPGKGRQFRSGFVRLDGEVGTDGKFHYVVTVTGDHRSLVKLAVEAVQQWQFRPAMCQGKPISFPMTVDVEFESALR
jgi:hypothetical protein